MNWGVAERERLECSLLAVEVIVLYQCMVEKTSLQSFFSMFKKSKNKTNQMDNKHRLFKNKKNFVKH